MNEHIPKCVLNFIREKTNTKTKAVINATKRSLIAEHLINNVDCATIIYRDLSLLTIVQIPFIWLD